MKKRIICMLLAALMVVAVFPLEAFAVTSIKGAYVGQEFGMVIDVVNNSTSYSVSGDVPPGLSASGSYTRTNDNYALSLSLTGTPTTAGSYSFRVTYYKPNSDTVEKTVSYIMAVGEKAPFTCVQEGSLFVEKWPNKTEYYLHDTLDTTGMKVTVTAYKPSTSNPGYLEPFTYDVTDLCSVTPTYFTQDDVAISCVVSCVLPVYPSGDLQTLTGTFRVTFKQADANTVTGMEVLSSPTKLTYTKGESLNTSGLTLRLKKYSGATEDVTKGFTCEPTVLNTVGTQTVTVKYGDKTATFDVTVTEAVSSVSSSASSSVQASSSQVSSSVPESSSEPEPVVSSEPESSVLESVVEPEPSSSVPESVVEPESSEPETESANAPVEEKKSSLGWIWIIVGLGVIAVAAGIGLFVLGKKKLDE